MPIWGDAFMRGKHWGISATAAFAVGALVLGMAAGLAAPPPAHAAPTEGTVHSVQIRPSTATDLCWTPSARQAGASIVLQRCEPGDAMQRWSVLANDRVFLTGADGNVHSNLCLDNYGNSRQPRPVQLTTACGTSDSNALWAYMPRAEPGRGPAGAFYNLPNAICAAATRMGDPVQPGASV